jgi:hypothetical protein
MGKRELAVVAIVTFSFGDTGAGLASPPNTDFSPSGYGNSLTKDQSSQFLPVEDIPVVALDAAAAPALVDISDTTVEKVEGDVSAARGYLCESCPVIQGRRRFR